MPSETHRLDVGTLTRTTIGVVAALSGIVGVMVVLLYPVLQALQGGS